jgi:hypothetical protein
MDAESDTFFYQGAGDDMNSEINGVSDFQSSNGDQTTLRKVNS